MPRLRLVSSEVFDSFQARDATHRTPLIGRLGIFGAEVTTSKFIDAHVLNS